VLITVDEVPGVFKVVGVYPSENELILKAVKV
jgi:hypothetical protein